MFKGRQSTQKNPGDLRRLAIVQIWEKGQELTQVWKIHKLTTIAPFL